MKTDEKTCLLDDLQGLLENQIELLRKSDYNGVEVLALKANMIISQITKTTEFKGPQFDTRRSHLIKLYKTLELMIEAGKDSIEKQLQLVETGKKIINKYRNNI